MLSPINMLGLISYILQKGTVKYELLLPDSFLKSICINCFLTMQFYQRRRLNFKSSISCYVSNLITRSIQICGYNSIYSVYSTNIHNVLMPTRENFNFM